MRVILCEGSCDWVTDPAKLIAVRRCLLALVAPIVTAEPKKDDCKCSCAAICGCAMKD